MLDIFSRKVIHAEAHPYERELLARDLTDLHVGPPTMCSVPETGPAQNPCYSADMGISQRKESGVTTNQRGVRSAIRAISGAVVCAFVVAAIPAVANAAVHQGTRACGAQYGWLTGTVGAGSENEMRPPGSDRIYAIPSGGSATRVASTTAGLPKVGGGSWYVYSSGSSATGRPFCENFG